MTKLNCFLFSLNRAMSYAKAPLKISVILINQISPQLSFFLAPKPRDIPILRIIH